jgi:hypothetical protein
LKIGAALKYSIALLTLCNSSAVGTGGKTHEKIATYTAFHPGAKL